MTNNIQKKDILAEIVKYTADTIISVDADHNIVLVNAAFENMFGYKEEEILGQSLNILLPNSLHKSHKNFIRSFDKSGSASRYMGQRSKLYGISKSGKQIPLDISIQKHSAGSFCRYTAICRDMSDQLEQEMMILENEAKLKMLFNTSQHITVLMTGDGVVMDFNDTLRHILQGEPEKNIGKKVWDFEFWASETDYLLIEKMVSKVKPGEDLTLIANAIGERGQKVIFEISIRIINSADEGPALIVLEGKDITEICRSNKALVESEGRLARAQKMARLGNFEWIIATNETIWSDEVFNIFGLHPDSFTPDYDNFLDKVHPEDRDLVDSSVISALKNDNFYKMIHRILLPDGSEKIIEMRGEIFRMDDGTPVRVEGTMQNVTVSWKREQELLQAKCQAEEANIAKAQFLSAVSHELRTPLNAIIGFSSMIAEEHVGKINVPHYRDYAVDINNSGKDLLDLIQNILHLTSFELGSVKYKPCYLPAQSLLDNIMPTMISRAHKKNITIETNVGSGIPELYLDPELTERILSHLIDNAIKFSGENDAIEVNLYNEKDEFVIEVKDQGIGLTNVDEDAIFDLFVQKDMNLNRIHGGVGLGLTIVKNLTELQNGRVHVQSSEGKGSCFSVCFANCRSEAASGEGTSQIA